MKAKRKVLLAIGAGSFGVLVWGFYELKEGYAFRTSANASPSEVTFLDLPSTASRVGFFRDGINYLAEFTVSEGEFRRLFSKFSLDEVSQGIGVIPWKFGDARMLADYSVMQPVIVTNGLHYNERWSNGGGYTIVYDRSRSRAYYNFAKR